MSILLELAFYAFSIILWLLASPFLFTVIGEAALTGPTGFFINILPWAVLLSMVGRVILLFRRGASA